MARPPKSPGEGEADGRGAARTRGPGRARPGGARAAGNSTGAPKSSAARAKSASTAAKAKAPVRTRRAAATAKKPARRKSASKRAPAGVGAVGTVISTDTVAREAARIALDAPRSVELDQLVDGPAMVRIESLRAGYGRMEVLHGFSLAVGAGQSLCLIGPNGAGKSTVLHAIFGFADIMAGSISVDGRETTRLAPSEKLKSAGIAYVLQDNSVFPDMTVEENLWMGAYLKPHPREARLAADRIFSRYQRLAERRGQPARVLSGGERRLLEISRALVMEPKVLLVDEPSIGLEPRYIDQVFEILADLKQAEGKTIIMVEQNAKKGLEFADIGYVLAAGELAKAGTGAALLADPDVGRLFLGG
jgi:branched-chain amino acid transport system ATP-binding protein